MIRVVCGVISNEVGEVLLCQRAEGKAQAGLWEFPGGKVDDGEGDAQALCRELLEELSCSVLVGAPLEPVVHVYDACTIELSAYHCSIESSEPVALEHQQIEWVRIEDLLSYSLAPADVPIVEELLVERKRSTTSVE